MTKAITRDGFVLRNAGGTVAHVVCKLIEIKDGKEVETDLAVDERRIDFAKSTHTLGELQALLAAARE